MKTIIIKSYEEELGGELFKLYIPDNVKQSTIDKALDMASHYACVYDDEIDEEYAEDYGLDEHWKKFMKRYNSCNGIERFFGYLELVYGWKYEDITYDYEFEW